MNKKGQTLVFFVVLIPIFVMFLAFITDTGLIISEHTKLKSTTKSIIKTVYEQKEEPNINNKITELFIKNDIETKNLKIEIKEDGINIKNTYQVDSIFANIIGIKKYNISIDITGIKKEDKLIFEIE